MIANADGTLSVTGPGAGLKERGGSPKRWVEIAPLLFREVGGQATLAFRADADGQISALAVSSFPFENYERLAWYEQGLVRLGAAGLALVVLLATVLAWLVGALIRRMRRQTDKRPLLERRVRRVAGSDIGSQFHQRHPDRNQRRDLPKVCLGSLAPICWDHSRTDLSTS